MVKNKQLIIILMLLAIPNIMAIGVPQSLSNTNQGLQIEVSYHTIKLNHNYTFNFHPYNISNGQLIQDGISCHLHLINSYGNHLLIDSTSTPQSYGDYSFIVDADNFTEQGIYSFEATCNNSDTSGFLASNFFVTKSGISSEDIGTSEGIVNLILFAGLCLWLFLSLTGALFIPFKNKVNDEGKVISVNDLKYLKIFCIVQVYLALMFLSGFITGLADTYITLNNYSAMFRYLYVILLAFIFPTIIVSLLLAGIIFLEDKKTKQLLYRGIIK